MPQILTPRCSSRRPFRGRRGSAASARAASPPGRPPPAGSRPPGTPAPCATRGRRCRRASRSRSPRPARPSRHQVREAPRRVERNPHGVEVAVVDADDTRAGGERAEYLGLGVRLDHAPMPSSCAGRATVATLQVQQADDQEHRVSAGGARVDDLIRIDHEVLGDDRQRHRSRGRATSL